MGIEDILKSAFGGKSVPGMGGMDLPLDSDQADKLNSLISSGVFKDKADFMKFAINAYTQSNMGNMMSNGNQPTETGMMDLITKMGVGKGKSESDLKTLLVPLMITAFTLIYKHMTKKQPMTKPM